MRSRKQVAREKFLKGFNCSQAVFVAFAKDVGLKEKDEKKII